MKILLKVLIFALIVLAACQQPAPQTQPLPEQQPAAEDTYIPGEPIYETTETTTTLTPAAPASEKREAMFDTKEQKVISEADILCDITDGTLTFTFRNLDTRSWQIDPTQSYTPGASLVTAVITFNQYTINSNAKYYVEGVRQFGPGASLSENCEGVSTLAPGKEVTCTLKPTPLRSKFYFGGVNELVINVPGTTEDGRVEFVCI